MSTIHVAEDFSRYLGGRYVNDGPFSGEEFLNDHLLPAFERAREKNQKIVLNFDGVAGIPTSFLEEAFGGLVRAYPKVPINTFLELIEVVAPKTSALWPYTRLASQFMREAARHPR